MPLDRLFLKVCEWRAYIHKFVYGAKPVLIREREARSIQSLAQWWLILEFTSYQVRWDSMVLPDFEVRGWRHPILDLAQLLQHVESREVNSSHFTSPVPPKYPGRNASKIETNMYHKSIKGSISRVFHVTRCTSTVSRQKCVQNRYQHVSKINQGSLVRISWGLVVFLLASVKP